MKKRTAFATSIKLTMFSLAALMIIINPYGMSARASALAYQKPERVTEDRRFWTDRSLEDIARFKPASQIVVKFTTSNDAVQEAVADKYAAETELEITSKTVVLDVADGVDVEEVAKKIDAEASVAYAEPDAQYVAFGQITSYGYDQILAENAHSTNSADGSGTIIAVVDTGVDYYHEDLVSNIWNNAGETAGNGVDDDTNGFIDDVRGWDFSTTGTGDNDPMDEYGHGTHVSGIAAGADNASGIIGAAPSATIMPVKVLDDNGFGSSSSIAAGIRYAVDNGAEVINMSLGSIVPSSTIREAVLYAESNNVVVVAASGNSYGYNYSSSYPAAYPSVISVSATNEDQVKTSWSNWGKVEVAAPGNEIMSSVPGDRYAKFSGTSMASPFVAGSLALAKQLHPGFTAKQLRHLLAQKSTDIFETGNDLRSGFGFLNAESLTTPITAGLTVRKSTWRIVADNNTFAEGQATITATILDASGNPVSGETVNFTTTKGTLSTGSAVTNGSGEASTVLTADNLTGMSTVTANNGTYGSQQATVLLFNDNVEAYELRLKKDSMLGQNAKFYTGDTVQASIALRAYQLGYADTFTARTANVSYQVTNASSAPVPGLSGTKNSVSVGSSSFFGLSPYGEALFNLKLPTTMANGTYTFTATTTDVESGKTSTISREFNVQGSKSLLVIDMNPGLNIGLEDTDYGSYSQAGVQYVTESLENIGVGYDVWPYDSIDDPTILNEYPSIIFMNASQSSDPVIASYLQAGGNAYVSGNTDFATDIFGSYDPVFSTGWCGANNVRTTESLPFTCDGVVASPLQTFGIDGGLFDGKTYNINAFDLNLDSNHSQLFSDKLVGGDSTVDLLSFDSASSPTEIAGFSEDTGTSRLVLTGFDVSSVVDRDDFLTTLFSFLRPTTGMTLNAVNQPRIEHKVGGTITITGSGFETTGRTIVRFGAAVSPEVTVLDRNTIEAKVPTNLSASTYNVQVTSPFGSIQTLTNGLIVVHKAPTISSFTPTTNNNNGTKTITITGTGFRAGATATIASRRLSNVVVVNSTKITATVPANVVTGDYRVRVRNIDGQTALAAKPYTVTED